MFAQSCIRILALTFFYRKPPIVLKASILFKVPTLREGYQSKNKKRMSIEKTMSDTFLKVK